MKSQTDYSKEINKHKEDPHQLANILIDIGSRVSYLSDVYTNLELKRARYWNDNKTDSNDKTISDPKLKTMWMITEDGEKWFIVKQDLKACENARRTISKALEVKTTESYNQF